MSEKVKALVEKRWRAHRRHNFDGEYSCVEMDAKHTTVISEAYCFDGSGNEFVIPKEQAQKEQDAVVCEFCQLCREILGKKAWSVRDE